MMLRPLALSAVLLMAALAGCSGSDKDTGSATTTTGTEPTGTGTSATTATVTQTQTQTTTTTRTSTVTPTSSTSTTTTPPTAPPSPAPIIDLVAVTGITANGATVTWNVTDDQSGVQSRVQFGPDPPATFTFNSASHLGSGDKAQPLTDLPSCTDHKFRIFATDPSGNSVTTPAQGFRTAGSAPTISGVTVSGVAHDRFTVSWTVTGPADTKSHVEYGLTTALEHDTPDNTGAGIKTVTLASLESDREYHFKVFASSPCGSTSTSDTIQRTGVLVTVTIRENGGGLNSFDKGSTLYGELEVPKERPITFRIVNADDQTHSWLIDGKAHSSPTIAAGAEHTFLAPISLSASGSPYTMKCGIHSSGSAAMTGVIEAV